MFESYLYEVLETVLGSYIRDLDPELLKVAVWAGEVTLEGLELKEDAFAALGLPVKVKRGMVGRMVLKVPWHKLTGSATEVYVDDIHLLLEPCEWSEEQYNKTKQRQKMSQVSAFEAQMQLRINQENSSHSGDSWQQWAAYSVLFNLQLVVENIHVRYELDNPGISHLPSAAGFFIDSLQARSTDAIWRMAP